MSRIKNLKYPLKEFDLQIKDLNLIDQGIILLTGENGCGKTSLIKCLLGIFPAHFASWQFKAYKNIFLIPPEKRKFNAVFQEDSLFPHMKVYDNIFFPALCRQINKKEQEKKLYFLAENLGLSSFLNRKASELSGGEKQKTCLARCLMGNPSMIFLDEAFSSIDQVTKKSAKKLIFEEVSRLKIPCLLISHEKEDESLATQVLKMTEGRLIS